MTEGLGASLASSLLLVTMLGFRHGFDADHIAAVDGMTRARQLQGFWSARLVGVQFAVGHSGVILIAGMLLYHQSAVVLPSWLDGLGMVISACFLLMIGASNVAYALRPPTGQPRPPGPVGSLIMGLTRRQLHPMLVGVAFAMAFDAMAQAAFFASRGNQFSGLGAVMLLGIAFGLGMILADAGNGALLYWFTTRSDRLARNASRFSSGFVGVLALGTAAAGILNEIHQGFATAWDNAGAWIGVGMVALTTLVYTVRILRQKGRAHAAGAS